MLRYASLNRVALPPRTRAPALLKVATLVLEQIKVTPCALHALGEGGEGVWGTGGGEGGEKVLKRDQLVGMTRPTVTNSLQRGGKDAELVKVNKNNNNK